MSVIHRRNCIFNNVLRQNGGVFPDISSQEIESLKQQHGIIALYSMRADSFEQKWVEFISGAMRHPAPKIYRGITSNDQSSSYFNGLLMQTSGSVVLFGNIESLSQEIIQSLISHEMGHGYRNSPSHIFEIPPDAGNRFINYANSKGTEFFADAFSAGFICKTQPTIDLLLKTNEANALADSIKHEAELTHSFTRLAMLRSPSHPSVTQRTESLDKLEEEGFLEDLAKNFSPEALLELCDMAPFNIVQELHR